MIKKMNADKIENQEDEVLNPKDRGLGRGLGALFGDEEEDVYPTYDSDMPISEVGRKTVGIENLFPDPKQPRQYFDENAITELATSIVEHGLLQPILVRPDKTRDGMFEIIAGERRWRASQKAQLHEVPIIIRDLDDNEAFQIALVENLQRRDLSSIEEARGYHRLMDEFGHSHEEIAKVVGKSRSHVANTVRLLDLPDAMHAMLDEGDISMGHARALLKADDPMAMALEVIKQGLSVRGTEKLVAEDQGREIHHRDAKPAKTGFSSKDADTLALEKEVSDQIGMNVSIDMKDVHRGKMTINFKNLDQLDDILQRLAQNPKY